MLWKLRRSDSLQELIRTDFTRFDAFCFILTTIPMWQTGTCRLYFGCLVGEGSTASSGGWSASCTVHWSGEWEGSITQADAHHRSPSPWDCDGPEQLLKQLADTPAYIYTHTSIFYIVLCCRTIEFPQFGLNKGLSYLFHSTGKFFKYLQGPRILYSSAKWLHVCNGLQKTQLWNAVSNTTEGLTWKGTWPRRCSGWAQMVCF